MGLKITIIQKNINEYKWDLDSGVRVCCLYEFLNDIECVYMCNRCDCKLQVDKYEELEKWV